MVVGGWVGVFVCVSVCLRACVCVRRWMGGCARVPACVRVHVRAWVCVHVRACVRTVNSSIVEVIVDTHTCEALLEIFTLLYNLFFR